MRLVCPNCAAQYEVDDSAIPPAGRDVQCANCGDTWFQHPATAAGEPRDNQPPHGDEAGPEQRGQRHAKEPTGREPPLESPVENAPDAPDRITDLLGDEADAAARKALIEALSTDEGGPADAETPGGQAAEGEAAGSATAGADAAGDPPKESATPKGPLAGEHRPPLPRATITADDMATFQSEVARETEARQAEKRREERAPEAEAAPRVPTPGEIAALADQANAPRATPRPVGPAPQRPRPDTANPPELPDIENLTSTMKPADEPTPERDPAVARRAARRGGRLGFYLAILISVLLVALYAWHKQVAAIIPGSAQFLDIYVVTVDGLRRALDHGAAAFVSLIRTLLAQVL